jgi:UDP:flavonoid glycosyltransferase YjiC (YdhE family)
LPAPQWTPPKELEGYLEHSPKNTIAIGLGSPGTNDFLRVLKIFEEALTLVDARAVLTIPEKWHEYIRSERICATAYAPHEWLYARVRAAVHHGGAGTTSASLHAGVPSITLPLAIDQFFWGERMHKIGVGVEPIPQRSLTVESLAHAIQHSLLDHDMHTQATRVREALSRENGVQAAVRVIRAVV